MMRIGIYLWVSLLLIACSQQNVFLKENQVKLSKPSVTLDSVFFYDKATINYEHNLQGTVIEEYNENTGAFETSQSYGIVSYESGSIKYRASKKPLKPSDPIEVSYYRINPDLTPSYIKSVEKPNSSYEGRGIQSLIDLDKSELDFRSGKWLGFDQDSVTIVLRFDDQKRVSTLVLSSLQDQGSWIFPPNRVRITHDEELIHDWLHCPLVENAAAQFEFPQIDLKQTKVTNLKIVIYPSILPDWHAGAGKNAWLFLDEIVVQ
ncbi:MAG: hypothetical protein AB8B53_14320 [Flavobacteriales bacterium]